MCPACRKAMLDELEQIRRSESAQAGRELTLVLTPQAQQQMDALPCEHEKPD